MVAMVPRPHPTLGSVARIHQPALCTLIWSMADLMRGNFRSGEYVRVNLSFTAQRRLACVLAPTKVDALKAHAAQQVADIAVDPFVKRTAGLKVDNVSSLDVGQTDGRPRQHPRGTCSALPKLLHLVTERFVGFMLNPHEVTYMPMGLAVDD